MTFLFLLLSFPCLFWTQGADSAPTLKQAGIERLCVPPESVDAWRAAGFTVSPLTPAELAAREALQPPGIVPRAGLASPTRVPWVNANGWRFRRNRAGKFAYDVPAGKGALAAAEVYAYGADVVVKIDPADVPNVGKMLAFLKQLPEADLPDIADFAVVDDGTPVVGEVLNLLSRRNLLFDVVKSPSSKFPLNIQVGSKDYPVEQAADPSAFALKVRHDLTDDRRSFRLYGSEVVVARLTGDGHRARLHLLNYSGRELEGLRIRVRGAYREGQTYIAGTGTARLIDFMPADGGTEFTLPRIGPYTVIDLDAQ